ELGIIMQSPSVLPSAEQHIQQAATTLARSLFLLVLLALILMFITVGLVTGGDFSHIAGSSLIALVVILIALIGLAWKLLRTDPTRLLPISNRIVRIFSKPFLNLIIVGLILEATLFV